MVVEQGRQDKSMSASNELFNLLIALQAPIREGLRAAGRRLWGNEYPVEYARALAFIRSGGQDDKEATRLLSALEARIKAQPLYCNGIPWSPLKASEPKYGERSDRTMTPEQIAEEYEAMTEHDRGFGEPPDWL